MSRRYLLALNGFCIAISLVGCKSEPKVEVGKVQGIVRVNGRPQRGAAVQFSPDGDKGSGLPIFANGTSDEQGKYTLKYGYQGKIAEGAPVGSYRVMVTDTTVGFTPQGQEPKPSAIPMAYGAPATTPLRAEVKAGDNSIDLDIKK
jgi:hypothetical protein